MGELSSDLKPFQFRLEINTTMRCNATCDQCDRFIGPVKIRDAELTAEQMRRATDQVIEQKIAVRRVTLAGGEPILNKDLQGILDEAARLPGLREGRVLTNDLPGTKEKRDALKLPPKWHWVASPLDDPTDPTSGKNDPTKRENKRVHLPFWISPADVGIKAAWSTCRVRGWCGRSFDTFGFATCGKIGVLGRLFKFNPYLREGDIQKHVLTPTDEVCKHCFYGASKKEHEGIAKDVASGKIPWSISPTFREAFKRFRENPITFPRY